MTIEIKTSTLEPIRNTYANIERRFGDKPATRYQEATYDLQAETNFHYRPLWQPDKELNDKTRTKIVMEDWYALKDPRQFYYGAYVQQRAKMQEQAENNYAFFEKRDLQAYLSESSKEKIIRFLIPVRHIEHTANLNNMYACSFGYGTALTQALVYNAMDRLGIAQYLSRIGLLIDGNSGDSLIQAKEHWMQDPIWQGVRALCEELTTVEDWFEVMLAQNLVMDSLVYELFIDQLDQALNAEGARDIAMLLEFMQQWNKETTRWFDSVIKTVASESAANAEQMSIWVKHWRAKAAEAFAPVIHALFDETSLQQALTLLDNRSRKAGLTL
ncbi:aromatic/alkene monooxygenase hydroxylase subunit beta [Nitrincola tapanii]|uniref:Phenol hydroxylase n=1 Tax=Nitrincola tapanii TaxID=1708751 RepID=A0A5A9VYK0_9GAMM|nr:aromatic/alkene monooxygenase hydroxylase subunit beta [Nitrincola tapanii]KAA0873546.1 phenol hydroxylase [Nitrincola tapanii]